MRCAFDPEGARLAVARLTGVYLFRVRRQKIADENPRSPADRVGVTRGGRTHGCGNGTELAESGMREQSGWSRPCGVGEQVHLFAAAVGEEDEFVAARLGVGGDLAGHLLGSGQAGRQAVLGVRAGEGVVVQQAAA